MLKDLDKRVEGLDVNKSAFIPFFGFVTEQGDTHLCPSTNSFVESFNKVFGDTIALKGTQFVGSSAKIVSFLDKPEKVTMVDEVSPKTLSEVPDEDKEDLVEDTPTKIDLAYAESLQEGKSKKDAKIALEEYARQFEVELNRQKSFDNMLKDLKEQS